jgi:uncharacterized protein (DUF302 family)
MTQYGFNKELCMPLDQALERVTKGLKEHGFGVLTTIDVKKKFKEKLGIDFKQYMILGACNPASAHKAILAEENVGLMLPCNVIVYEKNGSSVVAAVRPTVAMQMIDNPDLQTIAETIEAKLESVMASLG